MNEHEKYMMHAINLAEKGKGSVNPNPLVGSVIVKNGKIIGEGYHEKFGSAHAEVNAFNHATEDPEGADMYVTLEPCSHYGKTPPCALKIIEKKVKRVFISQLDPNPLVSGRGVKLLKDAGIEVFVGINEEESKKQNEIFLKYIQTKKPFVALKYAMTLDGKIATRSKDSKWITNEKSRAFVHDLRNEYQAILVGANTILADDPMLTTRRDIPSRNPIRIILDPELVINLNAHVVKTAQDIRTIIYTSREVDLVKMALLKEKNVEIYQIDATPNFNLNEVMSHIGQLSIDSILVEGGSFVHAKMIEENIADKAYVFIAPKIIGGKEALTPIGGIGVDKMSEAYQLKNITMKTFDDDILIEGYFK